MYYKQLYVKTFVNTGIIIRGRTKGWTQKPYHQAATNEF